MKKLKLSHPRKLVIPENFTPLLPNDNDEVYPNGYFSFNIERLIQYVTEHSEELLRVSVAVSDWYQANTLDDEYVELTDLTRPLILAEISPDRLEFYPSIDPNNWRDRGYNLIDGHHRIEKAVRYGINSLPAYILPMERHVAFIYRGYHEYADYWNSKLLDYEADMKRNKFLIV